MKPQHKFGLIHAALALALSAPLFTLSPAAFAQPAKADAKLDPALPKDLFLKSPPAGAPALPPIDAKKSAKVGDTVTLSGRVGGSANPFVAGRSVLTIVSNALPACSDNPGDGCKRPWDYCCETKDDIAKHSATIQIVDDRGRPLRSELKGQNGIAELSDLTVIGKVTQVTDKVLVINAASIYVNPALPKGIFLKEKPVNAKSVEEVKASAKPGETVTITGRIGGSGEPFTASSAAFTLVGPGIKPCSDKPGDTCKQPWDYCCESKESIADHAATIQLVDEKGNPLNLDLRGRNGLKALSEVTVTGKVVQGDGKGFTVAATGIYNRQK